MKDKIRHRLFGSPKSILVNKVMRGIDASEWPDAQAMYKVIVNHDRSHPYSIWFKTRDHARRYKKILQEEDRFEAIYNIKQESTSEVYIISETKIF